MGFAFVTILWGRKYDPGYLLRLWEGLQRWGPAGARLVCVTDHPTLWRQPPSGVQLVAPPNGLPGWWQKINLFDHAFLGERFLFYVDLDVIFLKSLQPVVARFGQADLLHAQDPIDVMSSSLMLVDTLSPLARAVVAEFRPEEFAPEEGDQDYLGRFVSGRFATLGLRVEDHYSYKHLVDYEDWRLRATNPSYYPVALEQVVSLNFHGHPKPADLLGAPLPLAPELAGAWQGQPATVG